MIRFKCLLKKESGNIGIGFIIAVVVFILIILPILSQVVERYRVNIIRNDTVISVDLSLRSAMVSLEIDEAASKVYTFDNIEFTGTFQKYLAINMNLNPDLTVKPESLVDGDVTINELRYFGSSSLPYTSPHSGKVFNRPYFNVELELIIKPSLFRQMIIDLFGVEDFHYTFYYDASMPVDDK